MAAVVKVVVEVVVVAAVMECRVFRGKGGGKVGTIKGKTMKKKKKSAGKNKHSRTNGRTLRQTQATKERRRAKVK